MQSSIKFSYGSKILLPLESNENWPRSRVLIGSSQHDFENNLRINAAWRGIGHCCGSRSVKKLLY